MAHIHSELMQNSSKVAQALAAREPKPHSLMVRERPDSCPGKNLQLLTSQMLGVGEMSEEKTTSDGTRTSTSPSIVDHAGLKAPPLLLQTDSTSCTVTNSKLLSISTLK